MIVETSNDMDYVKHNFIPMKNKLINKVSRTEDYFEHLLKLSGLYYVREKGNYKYGTRWCYYDFFLPYYRIYIEIDGPSHNTETQKLIDAEKEKIVINKKRFVVRLTNEDVLSLKSISLPYLVEKLCEQFSQKAKGGEKFTVGDYLSNLIKNIKQSIEDMQEDSGIFVDKRKKVYLFNKDINRIFIFKNACVAKMNMQLGLSHIMTFLDGTDYSNRNTKRKYVLAYSLVDCIEKTKTSTGIINMAIGNERELFPIKELLPIMNEKEKDCWYNIPQKTLLKTKKVLGSLGFVNYCENDLDCAVYLNKEYPLKYKKRIVKLNITIEVYDYSIKILLHLMDKTYSKLIPWQKLISISITQLIRGFFMSLADRSIIDTKDIVK